jgi:hypothetical protein
MSLANQARWGRIVIAALITALGIPLVIGKLPLPQTPTLDGVSIRENRRVFPRFLEAVKHHQGVLVLGTSETAGHLAGNNYWALLNRDRTVAPYFSVLSGAGRCSYIWFPAILANPEAFRGLRVLYFLNPTYWRNDLNRLDPRYYERYNSAALVRAVAYRAERMGLQAFLPGPGSAAWRAEAGPEPLERSFQEWLSYYSHDLNTLLRGGFAPKSRDYERPSPEELWMWRQGLDPRRNASDRYLKQHPRQGIPAIGRSDFQYRALAAFAELAQRTGIRLVVFIGPYNGIIARNHSPGVLPGYRAVVTEVKRILTQTSTPFIDGTDLSYLEGVFIDAQHHSAFGAWKIEQKIAAYYRRGPHP